MCESWLIEIRWESSISYLRVTAKWCEQLAGIIMILVPFGGC